MRQYRLAMNAIHAATTAQDVPEPRPPDVSAGLYRAAIGTRSQERYLRLFTAFDARGGPNLQWHWPAFVSALNWLVYRGLWVWAFGLAGVSLLGAIAVFGVAKLVFGAAPMDLGLLALALVGAASLLCGLFADGVYYRICNRRILAAVAASENIEQAQALLAAQAARRGRWPAMALVNAGIALFAAVWAGMLGSGFDTLERSGRADVVAVTRPDATREVQAMPAAAGPSTPASSPANVEATAVPKDAASAAAAETAAEPHVEAVVAAPAASSTMAAASVPAAPACKDCAGPSEASSSVRPPSAAPNVSAPASVPAPDAPTPAPSLPPKSPAKTTAGAPDKPVATASAAARKAAPSKAAGGFAVQIGIFAQPGNASSALAKLQNAGLRGYSEPIAAPEGEQQRIRAGPFETQARAQAAAEKIRALGLPGVVVKTRGAEPKP